MGLIRIRPVNCIETEVNPVTLQARMQTLKKGLRISGILYSGVGANLKNQRTSGPVNAHLTPGPGIYFNAFIHVYSPRAGADNPLGTNVEFNRKPLSLCTFVASFKTISLKYDL